VKSGDVIVEVVLPPPLEELESGRYKYVYHGTKSEIDIEKAKEKIREEWKPYEAEGIFIESIEIVQVPGHKLEPNWIWQEGETEITEDHTDLIINFRVESPFPWTLFLIVIALAIMAIIVFLLKGTFEKVAEVVYKYPEIIPVLGLLALIVLFALVLKPKRR